MSAWYELLYTVYLLELNNTQVTAIFKNKKYGRFQIKELIREDD